jgi:ABC-type microcin C transport system duplicated ATPase subunit YejF
VEADGDAQPLLEVDRLRIEFPHRATPAVRDLSFRIRAAEIVGLVGESGSGKSLTALAVLGLVPAPGMVRASAIRFRGRELAGGGEKELRRVRGAEIGLVFQEPMSALNPVLSLGDQIVEAIRAHEPLTRRAARARALELMTELAIPDPRRRIDAYPHQLSGGQRQRAMLAIALAARPRLLIADEPTTALDAILREQILELLARLRDRAGLAVLLISHELGAVARICDRVLVLRAGELVEEGELPAVFDRPANAWTRQLLDAARRGEGTT